MTDKIEKEYGRSEFADYLVTLAEQVRQGAISSAEKKWTVPEKFGVKIHVKEKKGRIELKLKCRWSTVGDYSQQERQQLTDWQASMKTVKKRMASSFKEIAGAAERGVFPEKKSVDDLVDTSRTFAAAAEPEWRDAMAEYMDHLENFIRAVEEQHFAAMVHEIRDLHYRMKACHREFK